jgi:hypothetical protein
LFGGFQDIALEAGCRRVEGMGCHDALLWGLAAHIQDGPRLLKQRLA